MIGESELNNLTYANTVAVKPTDPNFKAMPTAYFQGRWFEQTIVGQPLITTITEGSSFYFEFDGPQLAIDFKVLQTMCIIAISIDQQPYRKLPATSHCVVSKHLTVGHHTARVVLDAIKEDDDLWFGGKGFAVKAIVADHVQPVQPTNKVAWFLGDSITAGIHVNGDPEPETNSYIQSYGNVAATALKVANIPMAFGATGVTTSGSGAVPAAGEYLKQAMHNVPVVCDQPDFCVVNYGTNDRDQRASFQAALQAFLTDLVAIIPPATPIIVLRPFVGDFAAEIQQVVAKFPQAIYVDTGNWQFELTDGLHPNALGSKKLGLYLTQKLLNILGPAYFEA